MFQSNQRTLFDERGEKEKTQDPPNAVEACEFLKKFWDQRVDCNIGNKRLNKSEEHSVGIDI